MRHRLFAVPLLFALLLGLVATGLSSPARAQDDATPAAEDEGFPLPEGISVEFLAYADATGLTGVGEVALFRFVFEPDAAYELDPNDPSTALVVVEEGELSFELDADVTVVRAAEDGQFPTEFEEVAADEEFTLAVGDSTLVPGGVTGEVRNDGDEEAVLLISNIVPAGDESEEAAEDEGDDTAEDDGATPSSDSADAASETEVAIQDFTFSPDPLEISVGTTVTWTNEDSAPHTATADDGSFDSGTLEQGDSFSFTFEEPGTYTYFCEIHPDMTGTVVVS